MHIGSHGACSLRFILGATRGTAGDTGHTTSSITGTGFSWGPPETPAAPAASPSLGFFRASAGGRGGGLLGGCLMVPPTCGRSLGLGSMGTHCSPRKAACRTRRSWVDRASRRPTPPPPPAPGNQAGPTSEPTKSRVTARTPDPSCFTLRAGPHSGGRATRRPLQAHAPRPGLPPHPAGTKAGTGPQGGSGPGGQPGRAGGLPGGTSHSRPGKRMGSRWMRGPRRAGRTWERVLLICTHDP